MGIRELINKTFLTHILFLQIYYHYYCCYFTLFYVEKPTCTFCMHWIHRTQLHSFVTSPRSY